MLVQSARGYTEMGIFNAAESMGTAILFLPGVVGSVVLPICRIFNSPDDPNEVQQDYFATIFFWPGVKKCHLEGR